MNLKLYEKLTHVNYVGVNAVVSPPTMVADFTEYQAPEARMRLLALHGDGIVAGMELAAGTGGVGLTLQTGIAIDRKGRLSILATGGAALIGPEPPTETTIPVALDTTGANLAAKTALVFLKWRETPRTIQVIPPQTNDFPAGTLELTPWVQVVAVNNYVDADDQVVLGAVDIDATGKVTAVRPAASAGTRKRQGASLGALRIERTNPAAPVLGPLSEVPAADLAPVPGGLQLTLAAPADSFTVAGPTGTALVTLGPGGVFSADGLFTNGSFQLNGPSGVVYAYAGGTPAIGGYLYVRTKDDTSAVGIGTTVGSENGWIGVFNKAQQNLAWISADPTSGYVGTKLAGGGMAVSLSNASGAGWLGVYNSNNTVVASLSVSGVWSQSWVQSNTGLQVNTTAGDRAVLFGGTNGDGGGFLTTLTKDKTNCVALGTLSGGENGWLGVYNKAQQNLAWVSADPTSGYVGTKLAGGGMAVSLSNASGAGWLGVYNSNNTVVASLSVSGVWSQSWVQSNTGLQVNTTAGDRAVLFGGTNGDGGGFLTTLTKDKTNCVALGTLSGGENGWLGVYNKAQQNLAWMSADPTTGYVSTKMAGGGMAVSISTANGGGWLGVYNKQGKDVVHVTSLASGVGRIEVLDAAGLNVRAWMNGDGTKSFVIDHPNDPAKQIVYVSLEGPEAGAYVRGRATLANGRARVAYPEHFGLAVNPTTVTIQLTPRSAASRGLAVVGQDADGFDVQELAGGTSAYDFDYFAAGVRTGFEAFQPVVQKGASPMGGVVESTSGSVVPASAETPLPAAAPTAAPAAGPVPGAPSSGDQAPPSSGGSAQTPNPQTSSAPTTPPPPRP